MVVIETFWVRTARFPCGQSVNWRKKKFCYLIVFILLFLVCAQCKSRLDKIVVFLQGNMFGTYESGRVQKKIKEIEDFYKHLFSLIFSFN